MIVESSEEYINQLLRRAHEVLKTAQRDMKAKAMRDAASRAYYCMFYAASAMLASQDIRVKKHKSVIGLFGAHIVKKGLIEGEYGRMINQALDLRTLSDYAVSEPIDEAEVKLIVRNAARFLNRVEEILKQREKKR
ncbi:MAG: HEPN domain-containing protein [Candidatus Tectomicrobia bacterium]|nr:HEPN domain-containing protein [Candidatus Tectomicrobia bacterium]